MAAYETAGASDLFPLFDIAVIRSLDRATARGSHHSPFKGAGFWLNAQSSSHLMAAARESNRCLKRKSSTRFNKSGSIRKLRSGLPVPFSVFSAIRELYHT